jgi:hypothetical protein
MFAGHVRMLAVVDVDRTKVREGHRMQGSRKLQVGTLLRVLCMV